MLENRTDASALTATKLVAREQPAPPLAYDALFPANWTPPGAEHAALEESRSDERRRGRA
jgi:hypothetical protein